MIEEDETLQSFLLDEEVTVTLRYRDWIVLTVFWVAHASGQGYKEASDIISGLRTSYPKFDPCMLSPHIAKFLEHDCHKERATVCNALYPFLGLKTDEY